MLTLSYRPVQVLQNSPLAVSDCHIMEIKNLRTTWNNHGTTWNNYGTIWNNYGTTLKLFPPYLWQDLHAPNLYDVGDERRYVIILAQYQNDQQVNFPGYLFQKILQQQSHLRIKPYERIVHYQHPGICQQGLYQLELAQLTARQGYDVLVQQRIQPECIIQFPAQAFALLGDAVQQFADGRHIVLDGMPVPALLQIILAILVTIAVAECNVFDLFAYQTLYASHLVNLAYPGFKVELHFVLQQGIMLCQDFNQTALACSVLTANGNLLAIPDFQVDRLGHSPCRISDYSVFNLYHLSPCS